MEKKYFSSSFGARIHLRNSCRLFALFAVFILCDLSYGQAQQPTSLKGSKTMNVRYLGTSPKLTDIKPIPNRVKKNGADVYIVPNKLTKTGLIKGISNKTLDPVMQRTTNSERMNGAQVKVGFDGGSNEDNANVNGINVAPPDTQGDVGPNNYIQMTNSVTTIFDKSGNTLLGPVPNSVFFQNLDPVLAGTNDGDPVVLYDQFEDRWIVSQFAVSQGAPYFMLVAVSETSDPLGSYNQYAIDYGSDFPDYPKLGVWNDALYISTRDFADGAGFAGFSLVAINKFDMYNGEETAAQRFELDNPEADGILPADADGTTPPPAGEPHYSLYLSASGNSLNLITTSIDFDNPANSSLEFGSIAVAPYSFFQTQVPQPNGQTLDVLPFFLMYRLQYVNFGSYASMLTNHSVQEVSGGAFGIRWYEFRKSGGPWDTYQQGTFLPDDGLNRWMGSVAMNGAGDIALGYSVSSADLNPSIRFAGQTANESGSGILNVPETSILEGTLSSRGTNRWGDYSMMSIDPVDQDFWFTTEYIANDAAFSGWGTFISEMAFGDPPTAICQDIAVEFDANDGSVSISPEDIDDGSTDPNGGEVTLSLDIDTFDCNSLGENIVTLTVTSVDGITATCTAVVTVNVIDTEAPVAVCQDIFVELNGDSVEITGEQLDGGSTDNCTIVDFALDQTSFTELGTFPVVLTVTDAGGLTDSCEATVTVAEGAMIVVDPTSLEAAVDLEVDPPVVERVLTISNNGGVPLDFDITVGNPTFTPSAQSIQDLTNLDRSVFQGNRSFSGPLKAVKAEKTISKLSELKKGETAASTVVVDSIFYDSGVDFPGSFVGFNDLTVSNITGVRFDVPDDSFTLTAVRNAYRTEVATNVTILLSIYKGGNDPTEGELLSEQVITGDSPDGDFLFESLDTPLTFNAGEHFWVVHTYPTGIGFPQGYDDTVTTTRPNTYVASNDGGASYISVDGFAMLVRALSEGQDNSFITLSADTGTVAPGESTDITVAFDGSTLDNGVYETDFSITSNDVVNPEVTVATTFTVSGQQTPEIEVSPLSLEAAVDVQVDTPPVEEETLTITNNGGALLEFDVASGTPSFTAPGETSSALANLDRSVFVGNPNFIGALKKAGAEKRNSIRLSNALSAQKFENAGPVLDSISYDSGIDFPGDFVGFDDTTISQAMGVRFDVPGDSFTLTAVRNAYRTETVTGATILLSVYQGGDLPEQGTLLLEQVVTGDSADGVFALEMLDSPLTFGAGEHFWVVYTYPLGITFPQGFDDTITTTRPDTYAFSSDGGTSFSLFDGFASLMRALSQGTTGEFITLSPEAGVVAPGESVDIAVTFNGESLPNGTYETDLTVSSNDPLTPTVTVPTTFVVSGQTAAIEVSEELLLFNDVFIGNTAERTFEITNTGIGELTVSSISSDNEEFTVDPAEAVIAAGEVLEVTVGYTPVAEGSSNGILTISSDAENAGEVEIIVNGVGVEGPLAVLAPEESAVELPITKTTEVELTLTNEGGSPLIYSFPEFAMALALQDPNAQIQRAEVIDFPNFSSVQSKGFSDTRRGAPVPFGMGTDLTFGYTWMDSDEADGPVANFIDIIPFGATDVTEFLISGNFADGTVSLDLPYAIPFYGQAFETLFVNANGFVSFEEPTSTLSFLNGQIPVDDGINNIIAPFWTDLEPGTGDGGTVHVAAFADAIVVQWTDAPGFLTEGTVTFQIVIFTDGTIDVQYNDMATASFLENATVGIENSAATDGAQVAFNTAYVKDNFAVRFMKPLVAGVDFITAVTPLSGVVGVGQSRAITATVDAGNLIPGVYEDQVVLSSNSPDMSFSTATIELTVVDAPKVVSYTLIDADSDIPLVEINDGDVVDLRIFDTANFNIQANIGDLVPGSIVFDFNEAEGFRRDNTAPYAVGRENRGNFRKLDLLPGVNTVTGTPFSRRGGRGDEGVAKTIAFEIVGGVVPEIESFTLINADTNEAIGPLADGDVLDISTSDADNFSVVANVGDLEAGSVIFDYNGTTGFRRDNNAPYSLGGDNANGNFNRVPFELGTNTITATPFIGRNGRGDEGVAGTINFEVVSPVAPEITSLILVNTETNEQLGIIEDGGVLDLSQYPTTGLSIVADTDVVVGVGSVIFDFNGINRFQVENAAPYALNGKRRGVLRPTFFAPGINNLTATLYTERSGRGTITSTVNIAFEVLPVTAVAGKEINPNVAKVYPNPTADVANFTFENTQQQVLKGTLFNLLGQLVYPSFDFEVDDVGHAFLDMTNLSQGTYILRLSDDKGEIVSQVKVIRQ